jgi:agmatine deiminase
MQFMPMPAINNDDALKLIVLFDHLPAEFDHHVGTWMLWPPGVDGISSSPTAQHSACAVLARTIADFEPLTVCAESQQKDLARQLLAPHIRIAEIAAAPANSRKAGPAFLTNRAGDVRIVNWRRNAWGALYCNVRARWPFADTLRVETTELERPNACSDNISLRGTSIRSDGDGTFFVAEESISGLPHLSRPSRREFTAWLEAYCGARKVIWLPRGIADEHGVGRLEDLMAPVRCGVVALSWIEDSDDPRCEISREAFAILRSARDARDRKLEVVPLPIPAGTTHSAYVNFQLCNGAVIVPTFGDPRDAEAVASVSALYPGREIVELPVNVRTTPTQHLSCPQAAWKPRPESA